MMQTHTQEHCIPDKSPPSALTPPHLDSFSESASLRKFDWAECCSPHYIALQIKFESAAGKT